MVTEQDNATIERMIAEGKTAIAIRAAVPNVSRTNVYLKIAKYKRHGTVKRVQTKTLGRPRAMGEGVDKFLQGLLTAKPDMELEEMRRHLQDQLQLTVSMSTISRAISRAGINGGRPTRSRTCRKRKTGEATALTGSDEMVAVEDVQLTDMHPGDSNDDVATGSVVDHDAPLQPVHWDEMPPPDTSSMHSHHHHAQQIQYAPMQMPSQHDQHHSIHALDPSLAQSYPGPPVYHSIYAGVPREGAQTTVALNPDPSPAIDVYRSPYAPL